MHEFHECCPVGPRFGGSAVSPRPPRARIPAWIPNAMADDRRAAMLVEFLRAAEAGECALMQHSLRGERWLLDARDDEGRCGLHIAALHGQEGAVRLLLRAGAAVDARNRVSVARSAPV